MLWAFPEPPTADRLRSNSLCGADMAAAVLRQFHRPFLFRYAPAHGDLAQVGAAIAAARTAARLRRLRLGIVGCAPDGFFASRYRAEELEALGISCESASLDQIFALARSLPPSALAAVEEEIAARVAHARDHAREQVEMSLRALGALRRWAEEARLDALAVECWPRFMTDLGGAACLPLGILTDDGLPAACERDVYGAVSMWLGRELSGSAPFLADLVRVDEDALVFWHCGNAPCSLARSTPRAGVHANRRVALTMEGALHMDRATGLRLAPDPADGRLRLAHFEGRGVDAPLAYAGNTLRLAVEGSTKRFLDRVIREGCEHHHVLVRGSQTRALLDVATLMGARAVALDGAVG